jgi:uncharacterized membrane protein required for colicin V production
MPRNVKNLLFLAVVVAIVLIPLFAAGPVHAQTAVPQGKTVSDDFCSGSGSTWTLCFSGVIYWIAVGIGGYIASIAASFLNYSVSLSLNSAAYALSFTAEGWTIMRDLANMAFIFIIMYIAFTIMLKAETANTFRNLAAVIVVALLVNFSFFFTRVVIDTGNILAVQFYNAIARDITATTPPLSGTPIAIGGQITDLSAPIMNAVKVQSLLGVTSFSEVNKLIQGASGWGAFSTFLALSLLFIALGIMLVVIAASFLFAGVKFLLRVVGLWFVIIASPLAFAARALPSNSTAMYLYGEWRSALINFTFYPAVYLFIFYIITQFMKRISGQSLTSGAVSGVFTGSTTSDTISPLIAGAAIRVGIICILLYLAYTLADKIVKTGNQMTSRILGWAGGTIRGSAWLGGRTIVPLTAFAGRNLLGRGAYNLSRSNAVQDLAARSPLGSLIKSGLTKAGSATYDVRNAPGGSILNKVATKAMATAGLGTASFNLGTAGGKGGFAAQSEAQRKAIKKRADALKGGADEEQKAQREFEQQYDNINGAGSYNTRVTELNNRRNQLRGEVVASEQAARAFASSNESLAKEHKDKAARARTDLKNIQKQLDDLEGAGKLAVELHNKNRMESFANRILDGRNSFGIDPSIGATLGATDVLKTLKEKPKKDKLAEAAAEYEKERKEEEGGGEEPEPEPPKPTGGGSSGSSGSGGGSAGTGSSGPSHRSSGGSGGATAQQSSILSDITKTQQPSMGFNEKQLREMTAIFRKQLKLNNEKTAAEMKSVQNEMQRTRESQHNPSVVQNSAAPANDNNPPAANDNNPREKRVEFRKFLNEELSGAMKFGDEKRVREIESKIEQVRLINELSDNTPPSDEKRVT